MEMRECCEPWERKCKELEAQVAEKDRMIESLADKVVYDCQGKYTVEEIVQYHIAKVKHEERLGIAKAKEGDNVV